MNHTELNTRLASRFAFNLQTELTPAQWDEMLRRNTLSDYAGPVCASHDFCDANMTMAEAFRAIMGREIDHQSDDDSATWSAAWDIAKRDYLTAKGE